MFETRECFTNSADKIPIDERMNANDLIEILSTLLISSSRFAIKVFAVLLRPSWLRFLRARFVEIDEKITGLNLNRSSFARLLLLDNSFYVNFIILAKEEKSYANFFFEFSQLFGNVSGT